MATEPSEQKMAEGTGSTSLEDIPRPDQAEGRKPKIRRWVLEALLAVICVFIGAGLSWCMQEHKEKKNLQTNLREADRYMVSNRPEQTQRALAIYEQRIQEISPDDEALLYARVKRKIGRCYLALSQESSEQGTLMAAQGAFESALSIHARRKDTLEESKTANDLATTHLKLSDLTDRGRNLKTALDYAERASVKLTSTKAPEDYVENQINLCQIHKKLADDPLDPAALSHLNTAFNAASFALSALPDTTPSSRRGRALRCRGNSFLALSFHEDRSENLERAIASYEDALEYSPLEQDSFMFALIKSNLASAFVYLSEIEERPENLRKALEVYSDVLDVYAPGSLPRAMTHVNMAEAYRSLAEIKDRLPNLKKAEEEYKLAQDDLVAKDDPVPYATLHANMGRVYFDIAKLEQRAANNHEAIKHYNKALGVFKVTNYRTWHAQVQFDLGEAFVSLAGVEERNKNLLAAWRCFKSVDQNLPTQGYEVLRQDLKAKLARIEAQLPATSPERLNTI